jgi:hypothetical protein
MRRLGADRPLSSDALDISFNDHMGLEQLIFHPGGAPLKGAGTLTALVEHGLEMDPYQGDSFLFGSR